MAGKDEKIVEDEKIVKENRKVLTEKIKKYPNADGRGLRKLFFLRHLKSTNSVPRSARFAGIDESTGYRWRKAYLEQELNGFVPDPEEGTSSEPGAPSSNPGEEKRRGPGAPSRVTPEAKKALRAAIAAKEVTTPKKAWIKLEELGCKYSHQNSVYRVLKKHRIKLPAKKRAKGKGATSKGRVASRKTA
jgi:transposase